MALQELIRSVPLFKLVEESQMADLVQLLRPVTFEAGERLFEQGESGLAMWVLGEGTEVALSARTEPDAPPILVANARQGDTIGEMALVDDGPRSASAVVTRGGPAYRIDGAEFHALRDARHPAAYRVLRKICVDLCAKVRATNDRIAPPSPEALSGPPLKARPIPSPDALNEFAPFRAMPQVVKLALAQKMTLVETSDAQPVFGEGDRADAAYFVVSGQVVASRGGRTLNTLGPGSMFGIVGLIDGGGRAARCVTAGPAKLFRLGASEFEALFAAGNRFSYDLVNMVARQLTHYVRAANALLRAQEQADQPRAADSGEELLPLDMELELILSQDA